MEELFFKGQRFISSKRASEITGYTKDYIGQLCRAEKIDARLVGRNWYVSEESVVKHRGGDAKEQQTRTGKDLSMLLGPTKYVNAAFSVETPYYKKDSSPLLPQINKKAEPTPLSGAVQVKNITHETVRPEGSVSDRQSSEIPFSAENTVESANQPASAVYELGKTPEADTPLATARVRRVPVARIAGALVLVGILAVSALFFEGVSSYDVSGAGASVADSVSLSFIGEK